MSNSHRLPYAALGGCLAVILGVSLTLAQEPSSPSKDPAEAQQPKAEQAQPLPAASSAPPKEKQTPAGFEGYSEQSTEYYAKADLTAQERMAKGTEELVRLTDRQNVITAIEATLLAMTIFFTAFAAIAASKAARAADRAVEVTSETAQHQLRAYVMISHPIWTYPTDDSNFAVSLVWENTGQTPARRCMARASRGVFKDGLPDAFDYPDKASETKTETSSIGTSKTQKLTVGFDRSDVEAALRGEKSLFVWGWIEYDDMFTGTSRHRTEVCLRINVKAGGQEIEPAVTGPFNGIDDGCHHQTKTQ